MKPARLRSPINADLRGPKFTYNLDTPTPTFPQEFPPIVGEFLDTDGISGSSESERFGG